MKKIFFCLLLLLMAKTAFASTLSGTVKFTGTPPVPEKLAMNADPLCASLHPEPVYAENVVVNANGALKNVFVYLKEGVEKKPYPVPPTPVVFDQKGCQYHPHVFGIQVEQTLQIVNSDATLHNVHSLAAKSKQFNLGMPIQGMKLTKKFEAPEIMAKFKCDVHPWMSAYAGVIEHPFFHVSGEDGTFAIKDVPPGTYTVEAWHEQYGTQTQSVAVVEEQDATVEFTFVG